MKAVVAVLVATFALMAWPGMKELYSLVAAPMMRMLPNGATMIATDVTGTFFIPLKVTLMAGFLISLPVVLYQMWAFVAPGLYAQKEDGAADHRVVHAAVLRRHGVRVFRRVPVDLQDFRQLYAGGRADGDRHRQSTGALR